VYQDLSLSSHIIYRPPKEEYGSSPRFDEGFGLESDRHSYPTAYWKRQFLSFLQINSNVALEALIALVDFCTERWISEWRRHSKGPHPQIAIRLDDGSERIFSGNHIVFDWAQINSNRAGQLHSGLAALARWLCLAIDKGSENCTVYRSNLKNVEFGLASGRFNKCRKVSSRSF
jgi:hypothetical protein